MKKTISTLIIAISSLFLIHTSVSAHCQVPCGIYDDHAKVKEMMQDVDTIKKAISEMSKYAGKHDVQSANQLTRWVMNKESHAQKLISTISDYYLTQRVKSSQEDYVQRLKDHHAVIVLAMKAKQGSDLAIAEKLLSAVKAVGKYYPGHSHAH